MSAPYRLYGWELSLYSGKLRAYLRHKRIPFVEKRVDLSDLRQIRRRTGAQVMPVLVTPDGQWLQDTSDIMDALEPLFPAAPAVPTSPRQRFAAYMLEAWGDEFWLPSAMHYRWHFEENYQTIFRPEGGDNLLPRAPRWLKDLLIARIAGAMRALLPGLGVERSQSGTIEAWSERLCDALDAHFAQHRYLLGDRPCVGDYGLIGPLYAHLGRDPYPARTLIGPRVHLAGWIQRMQKTDGQDADFLPDDAIPKTLEPILKSVFGEFWDYVKATRDALEKTPMPPAGKGYPRLLEPVEIHLGGQPFRLGARSFCLWMVQRALDAYQGMGDDERRSVEQWLTELDASHVLRTDVPRLQRMALHVAPQVTAG